MDNQLRTILQKLADTGQFSLSVSDKIIKTGEKIGNWIKKSLLENTLTFDYAQHIAEYFTDKVKTAKSEKDFENKIQFFIQEFPEMIQIIM